MKPYQRYTSIVAAAALVVAGPLSAQSSSSDPTMPRSPAAGSTDMSSSSLTNIERVTKDAVKEQFTAKDLIGAEIYDQAGEKIGDVTDLAFGGSLPTDLAASFNMSRNDADTNADATTYPSTTPGSPTAAPATPSTTTPSTSTDDLDANRGMGAGSSATYAAGSTSQELRAFISVGGLWGIGDDLVSVPVSELSFNSAEDRFELSASKADVVALAEQKNEGVDYATDSSMPAGSTAAGKQAFGDEASKVQDAIANNPETAPFAYKVSVTTDGEEVQLRGTVDSEEQHEQVLEAARGATTNDIDDQIEVRE